MTESSDIYAQVDSLLQQLQQIMSRLALWQDQSPPPQALASTQPFCVDTLTFPQWLQFVFYERMQMLIIERAPLPGQCGIAPMAELYFQAQAVDGQELISLLGDLDSLLIGNL